MKKILLGISVLAALGALSGCDYFKSPEKKAYDAFVLKCQTAPEAAECKAWEEQKKAYSGVQ